MRTNSIISILRKRRALRRRASRRIKYAEALQLLKAYENNNLKIKTLIDNKLQPNKSISNKCTLDGCGHPIRYEYVLVTIDTGIEKVVGSTCVAVMLDLSKEQIKEFSKIETTMKDFHDMLLWRKTNMDVWEKLQEIKKLNLEWFKPFWEEVDFSRLHPEDEDFIRSLSIDEAIKYNEDKKPIVGNTLKRTRGPNKPKVTTPTVTQTITTPPVTQTLTPSVDPIIVSNGNPFEIILNEIMSTVDTQTNTQTNTQTSTQTSTQTNTPPVDTQTQAQKEEQYKVLVGMLGDLCKKYPSSTLLASIKTQHESGKTLTENQLYWIKVWINDDYFQTKIKGTPREDDYNNCDKPIKDLFVSLVESKDIHIYMMDIDKLYTSKLVSMISKYKRQFNEKILDMNDINMKNNWMYFRIKHQIILK
jgi:hypothetical protein